MSDCIKQYCRLYFDESCFVRYNECTRSITLFLLDKLEHYFFLILLRQLQCFILLLLIMMPPSSIFTGLFLLCYGYNTTPLSSSCKTDQSWLAENPVSIHPLHTIWKVRFSFAHDHYGFYYECTHLLLQLPNHLSGSHLFAYTHK